mgnify:CR=1 FL=1
MTSNVLIINQGGERMTLDALKKSFYQIKGKTIALVYTFQGDTSNGLEHFFIWKSKILSKWMIAVEDLHCLPLILDVRTFIDKAINGTLPNVDFVLNLNTGTFDLSVMALVPSTCSALGIPCIPCNAVSIVTGENKLLSNLIAESIGLHVPKNVPENESSGIFRPINLGNSLGVKRGFDNITYNGIYQEFISGYEITTPAVYNSITGKMDLLPTVMYLPDNKDLDWYNGEEVKKKRLGYSFRLVNLEDKLKEKYLNLINTLSIQTFCRIDARVKCSEDIFFNSSYNMVLDENTYFIEINVMPTIRDNNNFVYSFQSVSENDSLYSCITTQRDSFGDVNVYSFLLASSMMSFLN